MNRGLLIAACLASGLVAAASGLVSDAAHAADESLVLRQQAERLASQGRCDEALDRARRARVLDPRDARAALVEGRCLLRQADYAGALAALQGARELDPGIPGIATDLLLCHYHLDQLDDARVELDRALAGDPDEGRLQLYRGLVLLREAQQAEAAEAFDRAASLDPSLADAASLYAGRTWAGLQERELAEAALERARQADPDSEWGEEAERELERLGEPYRLRRWLRLEGGLEHDTNVPLAADISSNPLSNASQGPPAEPDEDLRGIFSADGGIELFRSPDHSAGITAGYLGNAHVDLHQFDLQSPWASLWLDLRVGDATWLRLQPFGGYLWLDGNPFVAYGGGTVSLTTGFGADWTLRGFVQLLGNDFLFPIRPGAGLSADQRRELLRARNRDGFELSPGLEARWRVAATDTEIRFGSAYERYWAEGRDWSRHGSRSWLGLTQPLPWNLRFEALARYTYRRFDDPSSFQPRRRYFGTTGMPATVITTAPFARGGPKRRDQLWELETELAYRVTEWLELALHWRFQDQESNTRVFDYERHVAGGTFTLFFGHY